MVVLLWLCYGGACVIMHVAVLWSCDVAVLCVGVVWCCGDIPAALL